MLQDAAVATVEYGMALNHRRDRLHRPAGLPRAWTKADLAGRSGEIFYDLDPVAQREIVAGLEHIRGNGFRLATVEQEDMRLPTFARDVPSLRARLDHGLGFFVLRGLPLDGLSIEEGQILSWVVSNYMGKVIRQNYSGLRIELLQDQKRNDGDPYRISQTNKFFDFHSDNGVLEPRPPNYIGLMCLQPAQQGGESVLVSAYTLYNEVLRDRGDLLPLLYEDFHADKPKLQTRAGGDDKPVKYPIFQLQGSELYMRYNRAFIESGTALAGEKLTAPQVAVLDYLDGRMQRDELVFRHTLQRGEMLIANNLTTLHSRTAYVDSDQPGRQRQLLRSWMWRRHAHPGIDPAELDLAELG